MKLSQFVTQTSSLDSFTLRHLRQWAERYRPIYEDPDMLCARMVVYLEGMDADDRDYTLSQGWTTVFDRMEAGK